LDRHVYDEIVDVSAEQAVAMARRLGAEEGILGGISSGATAMLLSNWPRDQISPVRLLLWSWLVFGERYLSTILYEGLDT